MKAITLRTPASLDALSVVELPDPGRPKAGEVRVKIHASSLNYHDLGVASGILPAIDRRVPLADASGVIEAVGEGVTRFAAGDRVISRFFPGWDAGVPTTSDFSTSPGDGVDGYASEIVVRPAHWFTRAPQGLSHPEAATLPVAAVTAWRALVVEGGLKAGQSVLVLGTGGVSIFALQIAKAMGATVIATSSSPEKLTRLRELGANHTINYRLTPHWGHHVLELTRGQGVDHVVEVGGPETLQQSITAVRIGGHISMVDILTGFQGQISTAALTMKQVTLRGIVVGSEQHQLELVRAVESTGFRPVIDRTFPLEQLADAFRYQASGAHFGKVCITV